MTIIFGIGSICYLIFSALSLSCTKYDKEKKYVPYYIFVSLVMLSLAYLLIH